ncbi:hypothetical protein [Dethiothermospora halolimnae]|uniref:hypothetical protein n=1 Tax=Dethiothermospora halolimnae TaxID=3114390 RepID=UPI003CCB81EF
MDELFNIDIRKYDVYKIANWIQKCRNAVKIADEDREDKEKYNRYLWNVDYFTNAWKEYYNNHIRDKIEEEYNKAIISLSKPKTRLILKIGKEKINISNIMNNMLTQEKDEESGNLFNQLLDQYKKYKLIELDEYYNLFLTLKGSDIERQIIQKYIEDLIYGRKYYLIEPKNIQIKKYKKIKVKDPFKLLKQIEEDIRDISKSEKVDYVAEASLDFGYDKHYTKSEVEKELRHYMINPNTLKNSYFKDDKLDHQKNLFINLAFYFGLDLNCAEALLNVNGFTIKNSLLKKDVILEKCFRLGVGQDYTQALLEKQGYKLKRKYSRKKK